MCPNVNVVIGLIAVMHKSLGYDSLCEITLGEVTFHHITEGLTKLLSKLQLIGLKNYFRRCLSCPPRIAL